MTVDDNSTYNNYVTGIENDYIIVGAYSADGVNFHSFYASPYPEGPPPKYPTFTQENDSPPYASTFLQGLNDNASLATTYQVGYVGNACGSCAGTLGVTYENNMWTTIQDPNAVSCGKVTQVLAINDTQQGVGFYLKLKGTTCVQQAFEFYPNSNGYTYIDFSPSPPPGSGQTYSSTANGINTQGDVVGTVTYGSPSQLHNALWYYSELKYYAFRNGSQETFGRGINFNDNVVGDYVDSSGTHGFFVENPQASSPNFVAIDYSSGNYTVVNSINERGAIAGWYKDANHKSHGFVGVCNGTCP
jgi:hypothetical protein